MKLALLTQAPIRIVKQSHPSFLGSGRYRIDAGGAKTKLSARIMPVGNPKFEGANVEVGEEFDGPCVITIMIHEAHEDKISVYAEKVA